MSQTLGSNGNDLTIIIPEQGETSWAASIRDNCFQKISEHTHTGAGTGAKIVGKDAIDHTAGIVNNDTYILGVDNAGSGTVQILKVDTSDTITFGVALNSPVLTTPQINDTSADHQYIFAVSELAADRTVTLPLLAGNDEFVFKDHAVTMTNKTLTSPVLNGSLSGTAFLDEDNMASDSAVAVASQQSIKAYVDGIAAAKVSSLTGDTNEIAIGGTATVPTVGIADNPVIPGTDSMVVPAGTTAQRVSTTDGALRFNSDLNRFEGYKNSAWSELGGGGGGLDVFHEEDFAVTTHASATSGNQAAPDIAGTGTLVGTLASDTSTPLAGTRSITYTNATSAENDFFHFGAVSLDLKQAGNFVGVDLWYTYNGASGDMKLIIFDDNETILTSAADTLDAASNPTRFSTSIFVPSGATALYYGFQTVVANNTKVLEFTDIQLTTNPFVYKNLTEKVTVSGAGNGTTSITANTTNVDFTEVSDTAGAWNGTTYTVQNANSIISISGAVDTGASTNMHTYMYKNGSAYKTVGMDYGSSIGFAKFDFTSYKGEFAAGDLLTFRLGTSTTLENTTAQHYININEEWDTEHVVTPTKVVDRYSQADGDFTVTGTNWTTDSAVIVPYKTNAGWRAKLNISGSVSVATTSLTLTVSGITFANTDSQALAVHVGSAIAAIARTSANAGTIVTVTGSNNTEWNISGDVELESMPTFALDVTKNYLAAAPTQLVAYLKDVQTSGTNGGTSSAGWNTRVLNTASGDTSFVTLSSNQFTLPAGKYQVDAVAPCYAGEYNKLVIYNTTDTSYDILGQSSFSQSTTAVEVKAVLTGTLEITSSKTYELRHHITAAATTYGLGVADAGASLSEVFAQVKITKLR